MTLNGVLTSYEKFIQIKICDIANKVLTIVLIVAALLLGQGLYALVAINAALNLVCFLAKWVIIKTCTPVSVSWDYWDKGLLKEIFGFSLWVLINSICSRLIMNVCPNILGITAGTLSITIFGFAAAIEGYSYMFASAIDGMFMPRIAKITYGDKDPTKIFPLMLRVGRFQYQLIGLIVVGFFCVGRQFIALWIGAQYSAVYVCALLLLLPSPFYMSQQIGKNTMVVTNKVRYLTYVNIIKAVGNIIFVFILSIRWGAIGACTSICIFYFFRNIANMILYQKKLGLDMKKFCIQCYFKRSVVLVISGILGFLITCIYPVTTWFRLAAVSVMILFIYVFLLFFIAFSQAERKQLLDRAKGFLKRKSQ